jgi:hypothetical protein
MSKLVSPSGLWPTWVRRCMGVCILLLASCGGGGGDPGSPSGGGAGAGQAGVGSGGTGSYSNGPITGFGSIIVNEVHYNHESDGTVIDKDEGDGEDSGTEHKSGDLKLGMTVEVDVAPGGALSIRFGSDLLGPITSLPATSDAGITILKVMNHDVQFVQGGVNKTHMGDDSDTEQDDAQEYLKELQVGDIVEVYGFENPVTHAYSATRIRLVKRKGDTYGGAYIVRGVIENLLVDRGIISCDVAGQHVAYAAMADMSSLSNGKVARFELVNSSPPAPWVASGVAVSKPLASADRSDATVTGLVTLVDNVVKRFSVNGVLVDASLSGISLPALGDAVTVKGSLVNGVIMVTQVTRR